MPRIGSITMVFRSSDDKLLMACKEGRTGEARRILDKGGPIDLNFTTSSNAATGGGDNSDKLTPLHYACKAGGMDLVRALLDHGAHAHAQAADGSTPLHYAAERGHVAMVRVLLNEEERSSGTLAAVSQEKEESFERDVVNSATVYGRTPLHAAAVHHHTKVVRLLLEHGANVAAQNFNGSTPLHQASILGHVDVATLLLNHGADISVRNKDGKTPVDLAKDKEMERTLTEHSKNKQEQLTSSTLISQQQEDEIRQRVEAILAEKEEAMYERIRERIEKEQEEKNEKQVKSLQAENLSLRQTLTTVRRQLQQREEASSSSASLSLSPDRKSICDALHVLGSVNPASAAASAKPSMLRSSSLRAMRM